MAYTDIDKPSDYFETKLYTGNGGTQSITGLDFAPNWVWLKRRDSSAAHYVFDTVRGAAVQLYPASTSSEDAGQTNGLSAFTSDGFSLGTDAGVNVNNGTFASWNWKAGTSFTNDASATGIGTIDSAGSANTTSGFSIVSYTGTGSAGTIKHGLSTAPKMIIQKNRDETQPWWTYVESIGAGGQLRLNATNAAGSDGATLWNSTAPTSSVFSVGDNTGTNGSADKCIAYCFAEKQGYSKFGSYTGNNNADGPFVYTGFKPAWLMIKIASGTTNNWMMYDNKRSTFNLTDKIFEANNSGAEGTGLGIDMLSNGFKIRTTAGNGTNYNGGTYIYMAFAENPFVTSTGVPATAR